MLSMFNDTDKFDGINWLTWSNNILSIAKLKKITGYLDSMIAKPTTTTLIPSIVFKQDQQA